MSRQELRTRRTKRRTHQLRRRGRLLRGRTRLDTLHRGRVVVHGGRDRVHRTLFHRVSFFRGLPSLRVRGSASSGPGEGGVAMDSTR